METNDRAGTPHAEGSPAWHGLKHDAFEVFGFRESQHDGVVKRLAYPTDESHVSFRVMKSLGDGALELVRRDMVRTGEGDKHSVF